MATNCSVAEIAAPPWIAEFFHSFQHRNFDFQNVSSVFAPTIPDYQQALFLFAAVPCLFAGLVFLIFCVHFIASWCSCDKQHKPSAKCVKFLRCVVLLVSVLCSGFVIAAFVFNDTADEGVKGVLTAGHNANNTLLEIQSKVNSIKDDLVDLDSNIIDVQHCNGMTDVAQALIHEIREYIGDVITTIVKIKKVSIPPYGDYVEDIEYYRWWVTFGTMCLNTLTSLLMIYAILRGSRCGCILAILGGTFSLALVWSGVGVDLAVAVGMSDLCVNPKETVYFYIKDQSTLQKTGIVKYYMECSSGEINPYQKHADKASEVLNETLTVFSRLMHLGLKLTEDCQEELLGCYDDLKQTQTSLSVIMKNLNCTYTHQQFESARCFICSYIVPGMAELLLMTLIIGCLLIINLTLVLPIYLRIPKHRRRGSILDMCGSDSPIGTPYQSISDDNNRVETVPLIPSAPPVTTYNSTNHRLSAEFHSCEESGRIGFYSYGGTPPVPPQGPSPTTPVVNSGRSNPSIPSTRGPITSMAF